MRTIQAFPKKTTPSQRMMWPAAPPDQGEETTSEFTVK
jgi:hypothetical protein